MTEYFATGYVTLNKDGKSVGIKGAKVRHVYEDCCNGDVKTKGAPDPATTGEDGAYSIHFTAPDNTHNFRCDIKAGIATQDWMEMRAIIGGLDQAPVNFEFQAAEEETAVHPCGAKCSTKVEPCLRKTTNTVFCYQHKDQAPSANA